MRELARRWLTLTAEICVAAGDNPQRLRSEACFSMLCGSSPIQASSGKTVRHRLM
jgi:transposase